MSKFITEENPEPKARFTGIFLPAELLELKELNYIDMILLSWIDALHDKDKGGCFASNDYLSKKLGTSAVSLQRSLTKLRRLGLIEDMSFDGRERIIKSLMYKVLKGEKPENDPPPKNRSGRHLKDELKNEQEENSNSIGAGCGRHLKNEVADTSEMRWQTPQPPMEMAPASIGAGCGRHLKNEVADTSATYGNGTHLKNEVADKSRGGRHLKNEVSETSKMRCLPLIVKKAKVKDLSLSLSLDEPEKLGVEEEKKDFFQIDEEIKKAIEEETARIINLKKPKYPEAYANAVRKDLIQKIERNQWTLPLETNWERFERIRKFESRKEELKMEIGDTYIEFMDGVNYRKASVDDRDFLEITQKYMLKRGIKIQRTAKILNFAS
jgi:Helix-turn-helix domain